MRSVGVGRRSPRSQPFFFAGESQDRDRDQGERMGVQERLRSAFWSAGLRLSLGGMSMRDWEGKRMKKNKAAEGGKNVMSRLQP
jgi:hypothetical protein